MPYFDFFVIERKILPPPPPLKNFILDLWPKTNADKQKRSDFNILGMMSHV